MWRVMIAALVLIGCEAPREVVSTPLGDAGQERASLDAESAETCTSEQSRCGDAGEERESLDAGSTEACAPGQSRCGDACVDLERDPANCGRCDWSCGAGRVCVNGGCLTVCAEGMTRCGGWCVDLRSNTSNCGRCGHLCNSSNQSCSGGICTTFCYSAKDTVCDDRCVSLDTNAGNCGACGHSCRSSERCVAGACVCPKGQTDCGSACRSLQTDPTNCGGCGRACPTGSACASGECVMCPPGRVVCDPRGDPCGVDLLSDVNACGSCERSCGGDNALAPACVAGACLATCRVGLTRCADERCHALASEDTNCGTCGRLCASNTFCLDGLCVERPVRQLAPVSSTYTSSARPWIRWELPSNADGARVEVCADRACAHAEHAWIAAGDRLRAPVALSAGVHFWRLFARRSGAFDAVPSPTWEFVVPTSPRHPHGYSDVNADGFVDHVAAVSSASGTEAIVSFGAATGATPLPAQRLGTGNDGGFSALLESIRSFFRTTFHVTGFVAVGDLNGDGYGDFVASAESRWVNLQSYRFNRAQASVVIYLGGLRGITPLAQGAILGVEVVGEPGPPYALSAGPAGDRDGDGYSDVLVVSPASIGSSYRFPATQRFGGRELTRQASSGEFRDCPGASGADYLFGDFDADGASDVVNAACVEPGEMTVLPGTPRSTEASFLSPVSVLCGATRVVGRPVAVLDRDDDGYDDLLVSVGLSYTLLHGGATGLSPARCEPMADGP